MKERVLKQKNLEQFKEHLMLEEKSDATVEKYIRDAVKFSTFAGGSGISKETVITYKNRLKDDGYSVRSINSMLASINSLFSFLEWHDLKVKAIKVQKQLFCPEEKELSKSEFVRLVDAAKAKSNERLSLILQTICGTGIRVSELRFITVDAVKRGEATVSCKGKTRSVFIVRDLQKKLLRYLSEYGISGGSVFVTRSGRPVSRTNIWRDMKPLCGEANVRHLFARVFYGIEKDIAKLADILGHSSVDTTRIYIISTGAEHRRRMELMRLII